MARASPASGSQPGRATGAAFLGRGAPRGVSVFLPRRLPPRLLGGLVIAAMVHADACSLAHGKSHGTMRDTCGASRHRAAQGGDGDAWMERQVRTRRAGVSSMPPSPVMTTKRSPLRSNATGTGSRNSGRRTNASRHPKPSRVSSVPSCAGVRPCRNAAARSGSDCLRRSLPNTLGTHQEGAVVSVGHAGSALKRRVGGARCESHR